MAIVVGAAVNWAKFRHPYMFPLEHQEWTRLSSRRRLALLMNGGSITGPQFLPSTLVNYFRPDGIRFTAFFPFVSLPSEPARSYGGAIIDQAYRTGGVPAFAPLLFVLGIGGLVGAVRVRFVDGVRGLLLPVAGAVAAGGGVMLYGYIAYRYTADFVPAMAICGSVAVVLIGRWLTPARPSVRRLAIVAVTVGAVFGIVANGAAGITAASTTWRGERLERYLQLQHGAGDAFDRARNLVVQSTTLEPTGPADELHIIGDCQALYLATGDQYEPWIAVELARRGRHDRGEPTSFDRWIAPADSVRRSPTARRVVGGRRRRPGALPRRRGVRLLRHRLARAAVGAAARRDRPRRHRVGPLRPPLRRHARSELVRERQ